MSAERNEHVADKLLHQAGYALRSRSKNAVYETYGAAKMAYDLGAICKGDFNRLSDMLVKHGLNDPQYCRQYYGGVLE